MTPQTLSPGLRWGLVLGLWVVVLVLLALIARNAGAIASWVSSWGGGLLVPCLGACGSVIFFSFIAAALHLSLDTIRGKYPY